MRQIYAILSVFATLISRLGPGGLVTVSIFLIFLTYLCYYYKKRLNKKIAQRVLTRREIDCTPSRRYRPVNTREPSPSRVRTSRSRTNSVRSTPRRQNRRISPVTVDPFNDDDDPPPPFSEQNQRYDRSIGIEVNPTTLTDDDRLPTYEEAVKMTRL